MERKLIWPDYENCIANLPNSVMKYMGIEPVGSTLPLADRYLNKEYKNVVVLLLDGMGKHIIENILDVDGPFRTHLAGYYQSVFLSTTVAATTSVLSGLQPCEHSWLGWDCYYPQLNENVTVFLNTIQGTEKQAAGYNVARTLTPYESVVDRINRLGGKAEFSIRFVPPHPHNLEEICGRIGKLCREPGKKYIYGYFEQPDGILHRNGLHAPVTKETLTEIEKTVSKLAEGLDDTLLFITADHGHIDNDCAVLQDYPKICECLERLPSLEPRVLSLFVREGKEKIFEEEFNKEFGSKFLLMPMEEAIEKNLFGTGKHHKNFRGMLGNYLAIATDNLSIYYTEERWVSMHGSITEEEMMIPLIVFDRESKKF